MQLAYTKHGAKIGVFDDYLSREDIFQHLVPDELFSFIIDPETILTFSLPEGEGYDDYKVENGSPVKRTFKEKYAGKVEYILRDTRLLANQSVFAKYPLWKQINALAGIYSDQYLLQMKSDIQKVIDWQNSKEILTEQALSEKDLDSINTQDIPEL
jgi:hypothetical protein